MYLFKQRRTLSGDGVIHVDHAHGTVPTTLIGVCMTELVTSEILFESLADHAPLGVF